MNGVINGRHRSGSFSIGVGRVRAGVVAEKARFMFEGRLLHPQRIEKHTIARRCRRPLLIPCRDGSRGPGVSRSCGHQIGILEEFTEFGCRLHGAEQGHRALGRHLSVIEESIPDPDVAFRCRRRSGA